MLSPSRIPSRLLRAALTLASLSLSLHVLTVTAFDPGRPARVAEAMLATPQGRTLAVEALSGQLHRAAPRVSPATTRATASRVVSDPALAAALHAAAQRPAAARGGAAPGLAAAVRAAVARANPTLARLLPARAASTLTPMPTAVADAAAAAGRVARTARDWLVVAATLTAGAALLVGSSRSRLLQRAGRGLMRMGAVGALVYAIALVVLPRVGTDVAVVAAAGARAALGELGWAFAGVFCGGLTLWASGWALSLLRPVAGRGSLPAAVRAWPLCTAIWCGSASAPAPTAITGRSR